MELKTQRKELTNNFWKHKAMKWWVQSFLIGIQNIVVGFRDNNGTLQFMFNLHIIFNSFLYFYFNPKFIVAKLVVGIVTHTERLRVPQLAKKAHQWSANVTFNFLLTVLNRLKELLEVSPDLIYYVLEFDPSKQCITFQTSPSNSTFDFLPNWFLVHFDKS